MERFTIMHSSVESTLPARDERGVACAAWHSLFWLVVANAVGVLIAILLLIPSLNRQLGEWTYGRWMMVHMNLELYGWAALPLVGFLFRAYGADRGSVARGCRPVLWVWSASLLVAASSWLSGNSSGRLFLDWSGYARVLIPGAMLVLWALLAFSLAANWRRNKNTNAIARASKLLGLVFLLAIPFVLFKVSGPGGYPAINPATGGPTGASQLESSLAIVAVVLILPFGIAGAPPGSTGSSPSPGSRSLLKPFFAAFSAVQTSVIAIRCST